VVTEAPKRAVAAEATVSELTAVLPPTTPCRSVDALPPVSVSAKAPFVVPVIVKLPLAPPPLVNEVLACSTRLPVKVIALAVVLWVPLVCIVVAVIACAPVVVTEAPKRAVAAVATVSELRAELPPTTPCRFVDALAAVSVRVKAPFVVPVIVKLSAAPPAVVTATLLARVTAPVKVMGPLPEVVLW